MLVQNTLTARSTCGEALSGKRWARETLRTFGRTMAGWVYTYFPSTAKLARAASIERTILCRVGNGDRDLDYDCAVRVLVDGDLPLARQEELHALDPRMPESRFTPEDCDLNKNGKFCDPDDIRIASKRLRYLARLVNSLSDGVFKRAVGRAVAWYGALLSYMVRRPNGEGVGVGI